MIHKAKIDLFLISIIIIAFSVVLYWFVKSSINQVMLVVMLCSPFFFIIRFHSLRKDELPLILLMGTMLLSFSFHSSSFRLSTVIYSYLFIGTFILYRRLLFTKSMSIIFYQNMIKKLLGSYCLVLVFQQILTILHLPVFNKCWDFPDKFKLNSLALEPSNTALIVTVLMFSFILMTESIQSKKYDLNVNFWKDRYVWFFYLYSIFTMGSTTGLFALLIMLCYFISKKNILKILLFSFILIAITSIYSLSSERIQRFLSVLKVLPTLNPNAVYLVDPSASARIAPYLIFVKNFDLLSIPLWLGYGTDYAANYLTVFLLGYMPDANQGIGGIINFFIDYGLFSGLFFIWCLKKYAVTSIFSYKMFFYVTIIAVIPFNHYVLWIYMMLMQTNQYFYAYSKLQNDICQRRMICKIMC